LAGFAGFALTTIGRDDHPAPVAVQLQQALATRALVLQAQALLMHQLHCSRERAFSHLIELSQQLGVKLQEAAQTVVDQAA